MAPKIQHKRSAVAGKAPLPADLDYGEIGVNYEATDPALYIKDSANAIRKIGAQPDASETVKGIVELATAAETTTGTDATRAVHPAGLKVELDKKAPLASPALTGVPTAPTAAAGTNTTQIATTAFVKAAAVWTRTGTALSPTTAGDDVTTTGDVNAANVVATGDVQTTSLNSGPLAGFRNILVNGNLTINQRGVDVATAATGNYGQDRWKKTAGGMTQIVEEGNFEPGATYTLSGTGITTQQLTAPASGNWTIPDVPVTARKIQLEPGPVATPFEARPIGTELALCQRYFEVASVEVAAFGNTGSVVDSYWFFKVTKRSSPTITFGPGYAGNLIRRDVDGAAMRSASTGSQVSFGDRPTANAEL